MNAWDKQEGGSHYKSMAIQPMEFALKNGLDYAQANVIKYVCRHAAKNGKQDLLKAIHNIELMIEHYYGAENAPETPQAILDAKPSKDIPMAEKCDTAQKSDCEHKTVNGCVGCVKWGSEKTEFDHEWTVVFAGEQCVKCGVAK